MRRPILALLASAALILGACSGSDEIGAAGNPAASGAPTAPAAPAAAEDNGPNGPWVQDLWVYESVRTVDAAGQEVDLTDEIIDGLGAPTRSVDLPEGATFHVYDDLAGTVTSHGHTRGDVTVIAGVIEFEGSRSLAALGTPDPDAEEPIGPDDAVELDLTFLGERLQPGDPIAVDFLFVQARPAADEEAASGIDLLVSRLRAGEVHHLAETDGEDAEPLAFQSVMGVAVAGSTRMQAPGKGPISGPAMKALNGLICTTLPIRCIRKYFRKMTKGVEGAMELLECNLGPCKEPPPPPPPPTCIGLGCPPPNVRADPHVTSFDGLDLSMQGVGEYVVTRAGDFEVQMRTAPVSQENRFASGVTMAALRVGDDTVQVGFDGAGELAVWAGGTAIEPPPGPTTPSEARHGDLTVTWLGNDVVISTPDSAGLWVHRSFGRWLDLAVALPDGHDQVVGLLGDADGNPDNDWTARDGSVLPTSTTGRELYTGFADTWRVDPAESILRYGSGEDTGTFTDLSFPDQVITLADLDPGVRARAEAVCRMAGVDEEPLLGQCILDYALSGELGFVHSAQDVIRAEVTLGSTASGGSTPGTPSPDNGGWSSTVSGQGHRGGAAYRHSCDPNGTPHTVWGGDGGTYTDDSSICTAAVHAGLLTLTAGGSVLVTPTPGLDDYGPGSTQHGITTQSWTRSWPGSFTLSP
ncbi:LCCL domain-containing protein [Nocardioides sp. AE5]|uniref:LCCL domain-containing protein n=1 Tax=Nocardioides sp. AE5 TaxID=2962573 RepID=UPI0028829F27|nr:LCCL domain-containing protein [Nocardioides sp. AE5]MDT0200378.1 LCCL domain-containing protein [Nocardioides sp. AE5]